MDLRKYLDEPTDKKEFLSGSVTKRDVFGRTTISTPDGDYKALDMRGTGSDNVLIVNVGQKQNEFSSIIGGEEQMITPLERREIPPLAKNYPWLRWEDETIKDITDGGTTQVATAQDLYNVRNNLSGSYVQTADIDLSGWGNWEPIGWYSVFMGTYNGNGYKIKNMQCYHDPVEDWGYTGLFGEIEGGTIINVTIENADIGHGDAFAGGISAYSIGSVYKNCCIINTNIDTEWMAGGITSESIGCFFENCIIDDCTIKGKWYAGGLVGWYGNGHHTYSPVANILKIENCRINATIIGNWDGAGFIGMVGMGEEGPDLLIKKCGVVGSSRGYWWGGGFIGNITVFNGDGSVNIEECYSRANVKGSWDTGGFIGLAECRRGNGDIIINNCYSHGKVDLAEGPDGIFGGKHSFLGYGLGKRHGYDGAVYIDKCYSIGDSYHVGFADGNEHTFISNCYIDSETTGAINTFALGKTTKEMQTQATYQGWDFNNVWRI